MKYCKTLSAVMIILFAIGCGPANDTQSIGKNVDPSANLEDVKSFTWTADIDNIPNDRMFISPSGVYIFNNVSARKTIKEAVEYELDSRGYKIKPSDADMLVSFYILEQADSLRTTDGYVMVSGEKAHTDENVSWTPVQPGTLIVNLTDRESSKMVWQGFASGVLKPEDINDESKIRQAVSSIFSQFNYDKK